VLIPKTVLIAVNSLQLAPVDLRFAYFWWTQCLNYELFFGLVKRNFMGLYIFKIIYSSTRNSIIVKPLHKQGRFNELYAGFVFFSYRKPVSCEGDAPTLYQISVLIFPWKNATPTEYIFI